MLFRSQPQLLLLQKTLVVVEGLCRELAPDADLWGIARDCLREWASKPRVMAAAARDAMETTAVSLRRIPDLLQKAELAAGAFTPQGLRLAPDSETALKSRRQPRSSRSMFVYGIVIVIAAVFFLRLFH